MTKKWLKYLIAFAFGAVVSIVLMALFGVFGGKLSEAQVMRRVSDSFFVAGALLLGGGALMWVSKEGIFNGLSYSVKTVFSIHRPSKEEWHKKETYAEYKERVSEKTKKREFLFLIIIGAVFVVLAVLFVILYHNAPPDVIE